MFSLYKKTSEMLVVKLLAGPEGFEPPTRGFGDRRSTPELWA